MNEDFRKILGTNGYNTHPDGAATQIEFCLAKRRPDGTPFPAGEDGINRINKNSVGWAAPPYTTAFIDGTIKPYTTVTQFGGWDPADFMNFWSVNISGGILGYAQFPTTVLGGMSCTPDNVNTDGVVMLYSSIGKSSVTVFPRPYNEGRTATHEIGHWLGLRHIWGDGGCGVDDFCNDTPLSDASNFGCPTTNSCADPGGDPNDMVENYMDYTDDLCMNIFTYDQKMRMRTVLENSPIRYSLINSDACTPPTTNDAAIVNITQPFGDNSDSPITPVVVLRNRGANNLTSATINYTLNGGTPTTFSWTGTIAPGAETSVTLPAFTAPLGVHLFSAYPTLPNGVADPDPTYDTSAIYFAVSNGYQPNYSQDFEAGIFPPDARWYVDNPNGDCYEWVGGPCTSSTGNSNNVAALMTNFGNPNNGTPATEDEYLYTPYFILPCNASSATFSFDKAYRRRQNGTNDRLRVDMSLDCGATWVNVFDQSGTTLQTVTTTSNTYWIPSAANQWAPVNIDLTSYVTASSQTAQFRFRGTCAGNGGNLYVDNVAFTAVTPGEIEVDVAGTQVLDGGYYDAGSAPVGSPASITFTINNIGTSNLILTPPISITGATEFTLNSSFGVTTVPAGGSTTFVIDFTPTGAGPFSADVSFATNDCDESTYNFTISGTGNVSPPTASFTFNPAVICEGSTVTYTDASTGASSWTWSFPGGVPSTATGQGPHVITYPTAGTYDASLSVTNAYGSDVDNQTGIISVLSTAGSFPVPITEGFVSTTFPPTNWTRINGGTTQQWVRIGSQGTAPTAGNSAVIVNYNTPNPAGSVDDLIMPTADFSNLSSALLAFDVAYARYDATFFDELEVLVSDDCGASYTTVYQKAGSALATAPDQTGGYTAPFTCINEVIDMSQFVGSSSVQIIFRCNSGYGQFLYIDNVNLTGVVSACNNPDVPTVTASAVSCESDVSTLTISGNLNDATEWYIYEGSCGGALLGSTATTSFDVTPIAPGTTYYVRGEDGAGCVNEALISCVTITVNVNAIPSAPVVTVNNYCGYSDLTATGTNLLWSTGETTATINVTSGGTYYVSQSAGSCVSPTTSVTAVPLLVPSARAITASVATTFCEGDSVELSVSQTTGVLWLTGETTSAVMIYSSGNYAVTYTAANGCESPSSSMTVVVNQLPVVTLGAFEDVCAGSDPFTLTGGNPSGGVFSGLGVSGGVLDPAVAGAGMHTITYTYTDGNSCSNSAQSMINIFDCLGVTELELNGISIYPNSATDQITLKSNKYMVELVKLYDAAGRLVRELQPSQMSFDVDITELEPAMYHVVITIENGQSFRSKIMKQ